jgi:hypothetical protein
MDSFVYRWRNTQTRQWYIGYHKGSEHDGYICSSETVKPLIQRDPAQWQRKILRTGTKQEMVALEHKILKQLQARKNPRSLNLTNGGKDYCNLSSADILGYDIDAFQDADTLVNKYLEEIENGDPVRIFHFDKWLIKKLVVKGSVNLALP